LQPSNVFLSFYLQYFNKIIVVRSTDYR